MAITIPVASPAGTTNAGLDTTGLLAVNADQLQVDMYPDIFWVDRGQTPICALLGLKARSKPAIGIKPEWLEDADIPPNLTPSTSYTTATSIVLTTGQGAWVNVGDTLLEVQTGEYLNVTAVSTDTLTVVRQYLHGTTHNIASTDNFLNLRQITPHGSTSPTALQTINSTVFNYCMIRRSEVQVTKTLDAVVTYGGNERQRQRVKKAQEHSIDWEHHMLHGQQGSVVTGNQPVYASGGLDYYITTNALSVTGALTEAQWMDYMPQVFHRSIAPGNGTKILFASAEMINTINSWGLSKLQVTEASNRASATYGIDIKEYVSGFGKLMVIYHPLLFAGYKGSFYIVDMDGLYMRPLRPTNLNTNIQANDADYFKDEYITEGSFQVANQICHGTGSGITF